MKTLIKTFLPTALLILPTIASAQLGGIGNLLGETDMLVRAGITTLCGLALLAFFWGLVKFIFAQGNEATKLEAKKIMGWGLVALFVMVSVWGIVRFMQTALLNGATYNAPEIPAF